MRVLPRLDREASLTSYSSIYKPSQRQGPFHEFDALCNVVSPSRFTIIGRRKGGQSRVCLKRKSRHEHCQNSLFQCAFSFVSMLFFTASRPVRVLRWPCSRG